MFGGICWNQSPSILSISSNRRNRPNPKAFSLRASSSANHLPLASKVLVRNLSYSTDETSLKKEFSSFGQVIEVKLFKDESTERSRGFAFVQYTCQDDAMLAIENLDRKRMDGRVVYVELAKPMNFRFAAYPRTSGPPTGQNSKNEICSEESSNGEMP
eukprot:TRINITY_DN11307_c0_g2_i1.p1 TRINITY_DN11307_c0_g2~~TRINITY_DN11307_c0_g2_i1.p1  ORF type:complete len:158 (+),score=23.13 TRINITY_DN11307_c0_g2_i1:88-561(+)